jgi:MFS family permease
VIRETFTRPPLRSFVLYVGLLFGVVTATNVFVQPIAVGVFETYFEAFVTEQFGVGVEASLGFLYAAFAAVSAVASYHAGSIEEWLGLRRAIVVVPAVMGVTIILPALVPLFAVPMFFTVRTGRAALTPLVDQFLNDHAPSVGRATVLSTASMIFALLRAPLTPLAGVISDWVGPVVGVAALGVVFLAGGVLVFAVEAPVDPTADSPTAESAGD